jgi:hypothetical protein
MIYETRVIAMIVMPKGEPLFSEQATEVRIVDEAGGEYVEVCQSGRVDLGKIAITAEEWPALRATITTMLEACKDAK